MQYESTLNNKDVVVDDVIFFYIGRCGKTNEEMFAVPGGKVLGRSNAKKAAQNLLKSNKGIKSPLKKLADKTVLRLNADSREGVDLVLGV